MGRLLALLDHLLLGWAKQLGLQPAPGAGSAIKGRVNCGMFDGRWRIAGPPPQFLTSNRNMTTAGRGASEKGETGTYDNLQSILKARA